MAAPITHIVLAAKIFDRMFADKNKSDFFVGTLFPDIRYLGVVPREKTHFDEASITQAEQLSAFDAGVQFHSVVDNARENYIVKSGVYELSPKSKYITQAIKLLEDEVLYSRIQNWAEYIAFLDEIKPEELQFGVTESDVKRWHEPVKKYFAEKPTRESISQILQDLDFSDEAAVEINSVISEIRQNEKIMKTLEGLYENFETILINYETESAERKRRISTR